MSENKPRYRQKRGKTKRYFEPLDEEFLPDDLGEKRTGAIGLLNSLGQQKIVEQVNEAVKFHFNLKPLLPQFKKVKKPKQRGKLSSKQLKVLNRRMLLTEKFKFVDVEPLHELWKQYAIDFLDLDRGKSLVFDPSDSQYSSVLARIAKLDFHGCLIAVQRAFCPSNVGVSGIIIQETRFTFRIVTRKNQVKTLMKDGSIFDFTLLDLKFSVIGSSILMRPVERSTKKMKISQPIFHFALKS
ncbi:unnamed protein product [Notodromas monacha]|uniref:Ribonuclease P protein subunit p29 n=1 Tax=Notodromas monacha TaxID=399045 RepID=A0A7R9GAA6_9CRUS|nr:unnamed protein product [Notodromas monacha]CAG0915144.1 unnamed protein product [Notodromas monacha]